MLALSQFILSILDAKSLWNCNIYYDASYVTTGFLFCFFFKDVMSKEKPIK